MNKSEDFARVSLHGVLPICATPFNADNAIDHSALRRVVEHIVTSGAHGLVYPAIASEFQTLTEAERRVAVEVVSTAIAHRTALVIGISSTDDTAPPRLAQEAMQLGADAVMLMPAPHIGSSAAALASLFTEVAARCDRPIILQNAPQPLGPALAPAAVLELIARVPQIRYVKEETPPCGQRISALIDSAPPALLGVFGGAGGRFLMDELARGAAGSMPACEFARIHVAIYEEFRAGRHRRARALANAMLPLLNFGSVYRTSATKEILREMGLIESSHHRDGNFALDELDRRELAAILADLRDQVPQAAMEPPS